MNRKIVIREVIFNKDIVNALNKSKAFQIGYQYWQIVFFQELDNRRHHEYHKMDRKIKI